MRHGFSVELMEEDTWFTRLLINIHKILANHFLSQSPNFLLFEHACLKGYKCDFILFHVHKTPQSMRGAIHV